METTYSNVLSTVVGEELHQCFIAHEVTELTTAYTMPFSNAVRFLCSIADKYGFDHDEFIDIIDEEYECLYNK